MEGRALETKGHIEMHHVTFGYTREPLLYDVSLSVDAGEMVGLLGPNGSGKTTLLRLLSGVLHPQQGDILLEGMTIRQWGRRGIARRIAFVPQELHVPFAFTVEDMVALGRTPFLPPFGGHTAEDKAIIHEAMATADIIPLAGRIFNELSGGERQRVMIAMALAQQPLVLLLDEPTSHLDIKYQIEILELVQRLNRERGVTVIAAMHDLNLAARYYTRLILFQRGIVADGGPVEVLEPKLLGRVYGVRVQVGILRGAEHLSVIPPGERSENKEEQEQLRALVHVMAGGGSGELLMRALADAHIPFVAGALNIGDSDYTLALRLAQEVIVEQPYAPISEGALARVRESLVRVQALLLCPMPLGPGNLPLLREALAAAQRGLPIIILAASEQEYLESVLLSSLGDEGTAQTSLLASRDYTRGEGVKLMVQLVQSGAVMVTSIGEVVETVRSRLLHRGVSARGDHTP